MNTIADQLQHFVENEALGLEEVAIGLTACGHTASADLLVEFGEGEQSAHRLPPRYRFEDEVALLQRRGGIVAITTAVAVNVNVILGLAVDSSWMGTG